VKRLGALVLMSLAACAPIEQSVRTERGPLLRSFTRPMVIEGGLRAQVQVTWPLLDVQVTEHDVCREVAVDEYAEERITEKTAPAAGASFSTGVAATLAAAAIFGISFLVSSSPDTTVIDTTGRFGPPPRTIMQGTSLIALGIGLPALAVGGIAFLRTGETIEQRRVEQETGQKDIECHARGVSGSIRLVGARGEVGVVSVSDGLGHVDAATLKGGFTELTLGERPVSLDETGLLTIDAFSACLALEAEGARAPESLGDGDLVNRADRLRRCTPVRGEVIVEQLKAVDAELSRRRETGTPGAFVRGPQVASFEEAVSAYAPRLTFKAGSPDLARLDAPETLNGQAVFMQGLVSSGLTENIGVLQLGGREVFVFIPPKRSWGGDFGSGARVEAVAVMAGWQTVGEKTLPLARLVFMRPAF
jgi:hypothetical protein